MKLFYSQNSPYARKCRVVMLEKKLRDRVELIAVNPLENAPELLAVNPLGTIPAMVTDEGLHLCDSTVICEYLDSLSTENRLYPSENRECVLAVAMLADGIMDAAVDCVLEGRRPTEWQYKPWVERKEAAIMRAIDKFSQVYSPPLREENINIGTLSLAIALAYISFRLPHLDWHSKHPKLVEWLTMMEDRDSLAQTKPAA